MVSGTLAEACRGCPGPTPMSLGLEQSLEVVIQVGTGLCPLQGRGVEPRRRG